VSERHGPRDQLVVRPFHSGDEDAIRRLNEYGLQAAGIAVDADHYAGADFTDFEGPYTPKSVAKCWSVS
jgi:hypothetical protein